MDNTTIASDLISKYGLESLFPKLEITSFDPVEAIDNYLDNYPRVIIQAEHSFTVMIDQELLVGEAERLGGFKRGRVALFNLCSPEGEEEELLTKSEALGLVSLGWSITKVWFRPTNIEARLLRQSSLIDDLLNRY